MDLLNATTVADYLLGQALIASADNVRVTELSGGVSNIVLGVRAPGHRMVVKQALPRLRVADEWLANQERALTEAAAAALAGRLVPGSAPAVLHTDPERCILVQQWAPEGWGDWKSRLLAGQADPEIARQLGIILAEWQRRTFNDTSLTETFGTTDVFEQLRVHPYYRTTAKRRPELAHELHNYARKMSNRCICLVHGDYSPKNVLVPAALTGSLGLWVIDFEVAHMGDPAFDPAFLLNHLLLKTLHRPSAADEYRACALAFWEAYVRGTPKDLRPHTSYVLGHVGCLMAARVDGKSPVEYFSREKRECARLLGDELLRDPPSEIEAAWTKATMVITA